MRPVRWMQSQDSSSLLPPPVDFDHFDTSRIDEASRWIWISSSVALLSIAFGPLRRNTIENQANDSGKQAQA